MITHPLSPPKNRLSYQKIVSFRVDSSTFKELLKRYPTRGERSHLLRHLLKAHLFGLEKNAIIVHRDDLARIEGLIFRDDRPVQLVGNVGVGKTTVVKKLIAGDKEHIYIVLDAHDEYDLPEIQTLTKNLTYSCRIRMPKQVSASRGLYPLYHNQVLSQKWPENYVLVVEEAHRYPQAKELLKEGRKFIKVIAICQEPLGDFCPVIKIVGGDSS